MTNDGMTNDESMTKHLRRSGFGALAKADAQWPRKPARMRLSRLIGLVLHSSLGIDSSFVIRHSSLLLLLASAYAGRNRPIQFQDVTKETGIQFVHTDGHCGRRYIVETVSAGLAVFDYDGDGLDDIYFLNGTPLDGSKPGEANKCRLYHNDGHFHFTDVTDKAGVGLPGYAMGVCVGDYENSGHPGIYVNCFGPNVLYRNNGDGTFTNVTKKAGVADGSKVGAGTCFLDFDGSGRLGLFVGRYLDFTFEKHGPTPSGATRRTPAPSTTLPS